MAVLQPSLEHACEVWNTNKCQAKALESIQLCDCKYILECSVSNCDEPVCDNLSLKAFKNRRYFRKVKWYSKVMSLKDEDYMYHLSY